MSVIKGLYLLLKRIHYYSYKYVQYLFYFLQFGDINEEEFLSLTRDVVNSKMPSIKKVDDVSTTMM